MPANQNASQQMLANENAGQPNAYQPIDCCQNICWPKICNRIFTWPNDQKPNVSRPNVIRPNGFQLKVMN